MQNLNTWDQVKGWLGLIVRPSQKKKKKRQERGKARGKGLV